MACGVLNSRYLRIADIDRKRKWPMITENPEADLQPSRKTVIWLAITAVLSIVGMAIIVSVW